MSSNGQSLHVIKAVWDRVSDPWHALIIVLVVFVLHIGCTIVYRVFFHPLASVPGPFWGKFSEYDSWGPILTEDRTLKQYDFLKKYGSPVRMSTNTLVYSDAQSWTDIYGQSSEPCLKDASFYDALTVTGATNLVNVVHRHDHQRLRQLLSRSFSARTLRESESLIRDKVEAFINIIFHNVNPGDTIDIYGSTHDHYLDIVSHLSTDQPLDCLKGTFPTACEDLDQFSNVLIPTILFTKTFAPALGPLLKPFLRENLRGLKRLESFARNATAQYLRRFHEKGAENMSPSFLKDLVIANDEETGSKLSEEELVENSIILLRAGSSTTAVTTVYLIWACGKHTEVFRKLVKEIRTAFPDPLVAPTYGQTSKLKYFQCVIQETLRLYGTLNVSLPRVSPGRMIAGRYVPAGVTVETNPYATARDPMVFKDPDNFVPERWLDATPQMQNMSRPFSMGPRNCIGRHLAEVNLQLTVSRLYQLFDIEIDRRTTDEMMKARDLGVMEPRAHHLYVRVTSHF